jgi:tetratricopeptide (TPR) repeat protein
LGLNSFANDIQDANKLFKNGQGAQALNKIDALLASQPRDAQARFLKALILSERGQTEESIKLFTALTEDYPDLPEPYNNLAVLYASQGQFEKAKVVLEKALRTHPSYSTAHENLGDIYAKMASQAYDKALQLDRTKTSNATRLVMLKDMTAPVTKTGKTQLASAASQTPAATMATPVAHTPVPPKTEPAKPGPDTAIATAPVNNDEILKAVNDWAKAWSSKNVSKYLAMYAREFTPPNNETRKNWERQRRERIDKPQPITVVINNPKVKLLGDNRASVSFIQSYKAGSLNSTTHKTLELSKISGVWLIQSEKAGSKK